MNDIVNIAGSISIPIFLCWLLIEQIKLKKLTIKNQQTIMAQLSDFQNVANEIATATQNISAYVQGIGMSSADQDTALKSIQEAVANLHTAIPTQTPAQE